MADFADFPKDVANMARDTAYVVVGLGVLGVQRAQVQRQELKKRLAKGDFDKQFNKVRSQWRDQVERVDTYVEQTIQQLESSLQPIEEQLPPQAREIVENLHVQAREVRGYVRDLVRAAA